MKIISAIGLVTLLAVSIAAQQRAQNPAPAASAPPQAMIVPAADLAAIIAKQPTDRNGSATFMQLDPYKVNMEHRLMDQAASVHEKEAELFYVLGYFGDRWKTRRRKTHQRCESEWNLNLGRRDEAGEEGGFHSRA